MEFKRILLIIFILLGTFVVRAQDNYFVYLQTENNQPFYARLNKKVISSTSSGYLILPKLQKGEYDISIGFPKENFEEKFTFQIDNTSEGFLLKNLDGNEWSLFNLQTLALISPSTTKKPDVESASSAPLREDPFSKMLANVTKDSTLLKRNNPVETSSVKEKEPVSKSDVSRENVDLVSSENQHTEVSVPMPDKKENSVRVDSASIEETSLELQPKSPVKILGVSGRDGSEMIYVDKGAKASDTIRVFIPAQNAAMADLSLGNDGVQKDSALARKEPEYTITPTVVTPVKEEKEEIKSTIITEQEKNKPVVITTEEDKKPVSQVFIIKDESTPEKKKNESEDSIILLPSVSTSTSNSDCKDLANNNDFLRIRKRMAAEKDNDAMVLAAKKIFRTKCFSTEQIRNLSFLFLNDEGRYMFFDAAYPYTSDAERFPTLISQLKDEYYVNRFKAMIQK